MNWSSSGSASSGLAGGGCPYRNHAVPAHVAYAPAASPSAPAAHFKALPHRVLPGISTSVAEEIAEKINDALVHDSAQVDAHVMTRACHQAALAMRNEPARTRERLCRIADHLAIAIEQQYRHPYR